MIFPSVGFLAGAAQDDVSLCGVYLVLHDDRLALQGNDAYFDPEFRWFTYAEKASDKIKLSTVAPEPAEKQTNLRPTTRFLAGLLPKPAKNRAVGRRLVGAGALVCTFVWACLSFW